jgi:hypothetical protein
MDRSLPWPLPMNRLAAVASVACLAASSASHAADPVVLQQAVLPDQTGLAYLAVDRDRVLFVEVRKEKGFEHTLEVALAAEPVVRLKLRCVDQAAARQVLDALRPGGAAVLDVSGRCRL